jgi:hypothetical protein
MGEHVDCAMATRELPTHIAIAANRIAAHLNFIMGYLSIGSPAEPFGSRGRHLSM